MAPPHSAEGATDAQGVSPEGRTRKTVSGCRRVGGLVELLPVEDPELREVQVDRVRVSRGVDDVPLLHGVELGLLDLRGAGLRPGGVGVELVSRYDVVLPGVIVSVGNPSCDGSLWAPCRWITPRGAVSSVLVMPMLAA